MMPPKGPGTASNDDGSMEQGNMDHGSMAAKQESKEPAVAAGEHRELNQLPQAYFGMWEALHSDNLADWQTAAELFYTVADEVSWPDTMHHVQADLSTGAGHARHAGRHDQAREHLQAHSQAVITQESTC